MKGKKILITGGAGFIGSHLIEHLFRQNDIICLDIYDKAPNTELLREKYGKEIKDAVVFVKGDVRERPRIEEIVIEHKPDIVFHMASIAGVSKVVSKPFETLETNVIGSYNLLQSLRQIPVEKFVFASTSEVYGPQTFRGMEDGFTTQGSAYDPRWSYSTSKLFVEHMCVSVERETKIPVAIVRLFNIYGPRQVGEGAIHNIVVNCLRGEQIKIHGRGDQIRAWCYVDDCLDGLLLVTDKGRGIFNIGNPREALSTYSLALKIKEKTQSKSRMVFCPPTYTDIGLRVPSIDKISGLGYEPEVDLDRGLHKTIEWYKSNLF